MHKWTSTIRVGVWPHITLIPQYVWKEGLNRPSSVHRRKIQTVAGLSNVPKFRSPILINRLISQLFAHGQQRRVRYPVWSRFRRTRWFFILLLWHTVKTTREPFTHLVLPPDGIRALSTPTATSPKSTDGPWPAASFPDVDARKKRSRKTESRRSRAIFICRCSSLGSHRVIVLQHQPAVHRRRSHYHREIIKLRARSVFFFLL